MQAVQMMGHLSVVNAKTMEQLHTLKMEAVFFTQVQKLDDEGTYGIASDCGVHTVKVTE